MAKRTSKLKRTQISLSDEELQTVRRLARERKISMSGVIRGAIRREAESAAEGSESLMKIVGLGESDGTSDSTNPDDLIYG